MGFLARYLVRARWAIIVAWVMIGFFAARAAPKTVELLNTRGGSRKPTEAGHADQILRDRFASPLSEFFAVTVEGPGPFDTGRPREALDSMRAALARQPYVRGVISWQSTGDSTFITEDHRTTFLIVALHVPGDSVAGLVRPVRTLLGATLRGFPDSAAFRTLVTGRAPLDLDVRSVSAEDSRHGEARLLPLTMIILVLAFGAIVAASLPLIVGFLAISVTLAVVGLLTRVTPMSIFVLNMTTMIGLGVGIDYSLLIVTRFREELNRGLHRHEAAARTLSTAGTAVITSGLTVVVGFAALLLTPLIETRSVGIGGLVVVIVAVALSITLLPALLAVLGRQIDRPRWLARWLAFYHAPVIWEKWARTLSRHPFRALTLGGIAIGLLTAPVFWIRIGLPARDWWPEQTEAGAGVETLTKMGVAGVILPIRVVVELPEGESAVSTTSLRGLRVLSDSLRADARVGDVKSVVDIRPGTSLLGYSLLYSDLPAARRQMGDFLDAYLSRDHRVALLDVILRDTTSLTSAMDVARRARLLTTERRPRQLKNAGMYVGGYAAGSVDFQDDLLHRFPLLVALILGSTAIMLAVAFKSVLVPIKAVVMNSLSVGATFGLIVLVFQYGLGGSMFGLTGPTEAIFVAVPVLVFAVVFGLSMDYEVFLLTRIKEAFDETGRNKEATMTGLSATASTITSAALVMILVFGVFAFSRVLVMQFLGFGLAVAVLLDATIIRMVLVPAFMQVAGAWNWWPGVPMARDEEEQPPHSTTTAVP